MDSLFFSVGEPSGDLHAANLIEQIRLANPSLEFRGFGGSRMRQAGCHIDFELCQLAVMGIVQVLPKLPQFFRVADLASSVFQAARPSAVVLVDFPGFNWHIAKRAKREGIPVFYYLPPQLWAWGAWRLKKMRRYVDRVLCNLPFEPQWYSDRGMHVDYVGHPFFDEVHSKQLDRSFIDQWSQHDCLQVVVLPGSRSHEVRSIWPMQLAAIRELAAKHPKARFLVASYREEHRDLCQGQLTHSDRKLNIEFFVGRTSELIELADCSLMKSGSVSLEMMARGTPSVVVYYVSRPFYAIGRAIVNLNSMTLPNLIAGETVMPEFLAVGSTSRTIQQTIMALDHLLADPSARAEQQSRLQQLAELYAQPGASHRAAQIIQSHLSSTTPSLDNRAA